MSKKQSSKSRRPKPPFTTPMQPPPGDERRMTPVADHGERSYKGSHRLVGRRVLLTGGDSGIGRAIAIAFAREGADIAISYLSEEADAKETRRLVEAEGRRCILLPGDLGKKSACLRITRKALSALGGIDILINNAAYQRSYEDLSDIPDEEFEEAFRVNVFALFYLCKELLPLMKKGGCIINTASIQSFDPGSELISYAATKAAIASLTLSLASIAIKGGIRVNAVAPGPVWTPLIPSTVSKEKVKTFGSNTLFGRPAQPAELAPLYVFLASDEASYITGEIFGATGGRMTL